MDNVPGVPPFFTMKKKRGSHSFGRMVHSGMRVTRFFLPDQFASLKLKRNKSAIG